MNSFYEELKSKAFSAFRTLSRECAPFEDANMLVGAADTAVSLARSKIQKFIDTEWIEKIESAIPALDTIIRNPMVMIEDVDEVLPVELSKHITEKSIKHLAQHTNYILDVTEDDEVVPLKILNVFHEESYLTYENKFINTLLSRLSAFVDKRMRALNGAAGIEMNYKFDYTTEFEHLVPDDGGRNSARINLRIELTSPAGRDLSESDVEINEQFKNALNRAKRINMALISYRSSAFSMKLGKSYIRPPVIRTNAILKNKNLRECLNLWEYIEGYDKVGYSFIGDRFYELPSSDFVGGLYSSVALQYLTVYSAIANEFENNRLISEKHLFETMPEFDDDIEEEEIDDYLVYDSEYKKTVPVSRLMNNRKKLSEDEKRIRREIIAALRADEILNEELMREEAERRRKAREERERREAEEKRLREEAEARRLAEEEARKLLEKRAVEIRYRRSFTSRLIQTEDIIKDYYTEIKNELLSYKGVKSRTSWAKESFNRGRMRLARMDVKGKTLYLYLALDPAELEGTKYIISVAKGDCPTLIKIKGERKKKHAIELIAMLMEKQGIVRIERETEDYRLPYEETDALIERRLIKVILPKGAVLDDNAELVKADLSDLKLMRKDKENDEKPAPVAEETLNYEAELIKEEGTFTEDKSVETEVESEVSVTAGEPKEVAISEGDGNLEESEIVQEHSQEAEENPEEQPHEKTGDESKEGLACENDKSEMVVFEAAEENVSGLKEETIATSLLEKESFNGIVAAFKEETCTPVCENELESPINDEEVQITQVENELKLEAKINEIIKNSISGRSTVVLSIGATPLVSRGKADKNSVGFVFFGMEDSESLIVVPYTRAQYLALPRKKKKDVLMNVKALLRYSATARAKDALRELNSDNERIAERIARLEARLKAEKKFLPTATLWSEAVKRVTK